MSKIYAMRTSLRFRFKLVAVFYICIFCGILVACNGRVEERKDEETKKIAMNVIVSQVPFWTESKDRLKSLEKELDIKTVFGGPNDDDPQKQINELEGLITQKVDGIIVTPTDSKALMPVINKIVDAGIPVVTLLADVPESKRLMYVTSELEEASEAVAQYAFQNNTKEGKVIILIGTSGSEEQERRAQGFRNAVAKYPKMKIVDVIEDKFDSSIGARNLKASLLREGKVNYIFGCNSRSASAAKLAVDELNYKKYKIIITGWDSDPDMVQSISRGDVYVSAVQQLTFMTQIAVNTLVSYLNGSLYPLNSDMKSHNVSPVPKKLVVPINLITRESAAGYLKK